VGKARFGLFLRALERNRAGDLFKKVLLGRLPKLFTRVFYSTSCRKQDFSSLLDSSTQQRANNSHELLLKPPPWGVRNSKGSNSAAEKKEGKREEITTEGRRMEE
jgi:hypothetical protein